MTTQMRKNGGRALALMLFWIGAVVTESILAIFTFKTGPAPSGMDTDRAYLLGRVWQGFHLVLLVVLIPGMLLVVIWRYLRQRPIGLWRGNRIAVAWLAVPTMWYLALMAALVLTDTVLPVNDPPIVAAMHGINGLLTVAIIGCTLFWMTHRSARQP